MSVWEARVCVLLLQDLLQSCSRGGEVLGADDEEQIPRDALRKVQHLWRT